MASRTFSLVRSLSTARSLMLTVRHTQPIASCADKFCIVQKRYSQVNVFGPFDPPRQLTMKDVKTRVLKAIKAWDRFPADKASLLSLEARFVEDLGFDSLDHVEITMALEDEFNFEIPIKDAEKLKTPKDFFAYICEREDVYE